MDLAEILGLTQIISNLIKQPVLTKIHTAVRL